jgi:hypothetical protein
MTTKFVINKGELSFVGNRIIIRDEKKSWSKILSYTLYFSSFLYGVVLVCTRYKTPNDFEFVLGVIIVLAFIPGFIREIRTNVGNELYISQIDKAVISYNFPNFLKVTFYLRNSQKRQVVLDFNDEDRFEKFYLNEFTQTLKNYSIKTEIE